MQYRKKPVVIEAVHVVDALNSASRNWNALPKWLADAYEKGDVLFLADAVQVKSKEGWITGNLHYWILQGMQGEIYLCDSDIFAATYEEEPTTSEVSESHEEANRLPDA